MRLRLALHVTVCAAVVAALGLASPAIARKKKTDEEAFPVTIAQPPPPPPANGAIYQPGQYLPLTTGARAGKVGDILTIVLLERTSANKSSSQQTSRDGGFGITPPTTGFLNLFDPSDINASGTQSFNGRGEAEQTNALNGEISVTVAEVYPNGTMLVRGEKLMTLQRGDEKIQLSGIVRQIDVTEDNRVASPRVANARIRYTGKGSVARASRQGWLSRFFSIISPF